MPLCLLLGATFGGRQRFCGLLTLARGSQIGLVAAALVDHALIFTAARGEQELPCRVHSMVFDELKPMPPAAYAEVITGPAGRASAARRRLSIEPALVERLLAEAADGADALPLLALTLERLYRDFGERGELSVADYAAMGGMATVVQTEVDNLLDTEQRQTQLDLLHDAFIPWLATINPDNDQPMRRQARWNDLPAESRPLIQAMVERRLLIKDTRDGQTVVEVALESLLRQWDALADWLSIEAADLKHADTLERAVRAWAENGCGDEWLLPGSRLTDAESLAAKPGFGARLTYLSCATRSVISAYSGLNVCRWCAVRCHHRLV
jgi:hypothetical protein